MTTNGQTRSYISESNEIWLETSKIGVTLKGVGRTDISVHPDTDKITDALESFVKNYNNALEFLGDNADRGTGVGRQLRNLSRSMMASSSLKTLGINRNGDGSFTFDKDAFKTNLQRNPDMTRDLLSGSFGLAQTAYIRANSGLYANPAGLVNQESQGGIFSVSYANGYRKVIQSGQMMDFWI